MAFSTALDGPGIFSLEQVQLFFQKMKLPLAKVIIEQDYFDLYDGYHPDYQRFYDFVRQTKLGFNIHIKMIISGTFQSLKFPNPKQSFVQSLEPKKFQVTVVMQW